MPYKDRKEYCKKYYKEHKDERIAYQRKYRQKHKDERSKYIKSYMKDYHQAHKDEHKEYQNADTNSSGITKQSIRRNSRRYLFTTLKQAKIKGYEIHHCFGYDDYKCFIYIPRELHLEIHQYLRDNNIRADSNHFSQIVHLINAWECYTYIKV